MAHLLKLAYQLRRHRLGGWRLDRWGITLAWGASLVTVLQWLLRGQPALPAWHWLILALLILGGLGLLLLRGWAARRLYVTFEPQRQAVAPPGKALPAEDKVRLWATGHFEVEGKARILVDLTAYWRTYASREHAVLAIQRRTRFLLAHSPEEDVGMWYIFIRPDTVLGVTPGDLRFGARRSPALCVAYRHQPPAADGKRPPKPIVAALYLAFDDETTREQVWADLAADHEPAAAGTG